MLFSKQSDYFTLGLMRVRAAAAILLSATVAGCGTSRADVDALTNSWKTRITAEIPVGANAEVARQWFVRHGLDPQPKPLENSKDLVVVLGSIPAREWYCEKWVVNVVVKVSPEEKVMGYDFRAAGVCL